MMLGFIASTFKPYHQNANDTPNANGLGIKRFWHIGSRDDNPNPPSMSRNRANRGVSPLLLMIIGLLVLGALYVLDFNLSIF